MATGGIRTARYALALVAFLVGATASAAPEDDKVRTSRPRREDRVHGDLFASLLFDGSVSEDDIGLRGAYFLSPRFALEGALSHLGTGGHVDVYLADLSAKLYLRPWGRTQVYLLGGPGLLILSGDISGDKSSESLHLGVGSEHYMGTTRLFIRPELKLRVFETNLDNVSGDVSVGIGWAFW